MLHVPYKGLAGAQTDLIGGQVQVMFATFNSLLPLGKGNKIKLLAVTGARRSELMPDVPTFTEQGIPEMENLFPWYAVLSPANTPKDLQNKIYKDFSEVMQLEEIKKQLIEKEGAENPNYVIACVGGGSNAAGAFYHFLDEENVKLIAVEAAAIFQIEFRGESKTTAK